MRNYRLETFETFTWIIWAFIGTGVWIQFFSYEMTVWESGLFAFAFISILYPFSTYLSKNLLKKVLRRRKILSFILQALVITVLSAVLIVGLYAVFEYLEAIDLFSKSALYADKNTFLQDFVGAFISVLFLNFGFCGLRFFEENLKLRKTLIDSQLQILQAQINPHFMFNILNHIHVLIRREPGLASTLLVRYTNILRYQLYQGKEEEVSLKQEINFMKDFIEIEKVRWKNNLEVNCNWNIENNKIMIPPLLFITFVENAFKHVSRSKHDKGFVKIRLEQKGEELSLHIKNSKFSEDTFHKKTSSGVGLTNIKRRLDILYPDQYVLSVDESPTQYATTLTLHL